MKIRFYNRDGRWFADLPAYIEAGGTEDDCEMVAGADVWLKLLSKGKDTIFLEISTDAPLQEKLNLYHTDNDENGAYYIAYEYKEESINHQLWLCAVTMFLFGEYPHTIHYKLLP